jgi:hypothetical protein
MRPYYIRQQPEHHADLVLPHGLFVPWGGSGAVFHRIDHTDTVLLEPDQRLGYPILKSKQDDVHALCLIRLSGISAAKSLLVQGHPPSVPSSGDGYITKSA